MFLKLPRTLVGQGEAISCPTRVIGEIDYEAELSAVIGEQARHVSPEDALVQIVDDLQTVIQFNGEKLVGRALRSPPRYAMLISTVTGAST